jgi:FAD:protein FMN transferase
MVLCDSLYRLSSGSFDVAIESLIQAWGFDIKTPAVPADEELKTALNQSGWENIQLLDGKKVYRNGKVGLNFGAIAKGYAVDKAVEILHKAGITEAFVNAGGEIKTLGNDWVAGVQQPRKFKEIVKKIKLNEYLLQQAEITKIILKKMVFVIITYLIRKPVILLKEFKV